MPILGGLPRLRQQGMVLKRFVPTMVPLDRVLDEPPTLFRLIAKEQVCSPVVARFRIRDIGQRRFHFLREPVTFALRDVVKDLRLAGELFKRNGATTPLSVKTRELYEKAAESAGELDMSAISTLYEKAPAKSG